MRWLPLWMRFTIGCQPRANDANPYLLLQQDFAELLARQLPNDAFHLQIKERSQNFRRVQAGALHDVINVHRFLGAEQFIEFLLRAVQRGSSQEIPLFGFRFFGLHEGGAHWRGELFDDVFGASDELGALLDEYVWRETHGLGNVPRHAENLSAELHGQARGDQRPTVLRPLHDHDAERHAGDDPVADREILWRRVRAQGKFTDDCAAFQHFFVQFLVFLGIADVDARAENSDGAAVGGHGSLMPHGINPACQSADDDQPPRRKFPAKTLSHLRAIKGWPARTHDTYAGEIQNLRITANVEQDWRIVDL